MCVCLLQVWCLNCPEKFDSSSTIFFIGEGFVCFGAWMRNDFFRFNMIQKEVFFWCVRHLPQKLGNWVDFLHCFFFSVWLIFRLPFLSVLLSYVFFGTVLDETCTQYEFFFLFNKIPFKKNGKWICFLVRKFSKYFFLRSLR